MQIDAGFTPQGFWANVVLQVVSIVGALMIALVIYWMTTADERDRFQKQIEHDLEMRRAEDAQRRKERDEQDRRQTESVRAALHYEIADNLAALAEFWPQVADASDRERPDEVAHRLLTRAVPIWNTNVWTGVAALLAVALESWEIGQTHRIYATLAAIREIQIRLEEISRSDTAETAAQPEIPSPIPGMPGMKMATIPNFYSAANNLIPPLRDRVHDVLARGNPIEIENVDLRDVSKE